MPSGPDQLRARGAVELRDDLASGAVSAADLVEAYISRIEAREPDIGAWAWFDADAARVEARRLDAVRASGAPLGPLHGIPIGLKDVIDTAGIPTENGCLLDAGRVPEEDAIIVDRLKSAGALVLGKTVTTELAFMHPNKTRNPWNFSHTPGGSSSGSAAAVADAMVPLAVGTQTGGSVIRPASFCGVVGFKPSFGAIPREGVLMQSHSLDTLGVFARDLDGAALLADVLMDVGGATSSGDRGLRLDMQVEPDYRPRLAFVRPPEWQRADPDLSGGLDALCQQLGGVVAEVALPSLFDEVAAQRARINYAEMAYHFQRYVEAGEGHLSLKTRDAVKAGMALSAPDYIAACAVQAELPKALEPIFARYDAILCAAATGPAPGGLGSTGHSVFNGLWTMAGTPAVTLPLLSASGGLPMGVQLVGPVGEDGRLLRAANWLWTRVETSEH